VFLQENYTKYDGFVILHGTDTMAYTASALSFMLENLGKPVILTGSQVWTSEMYAVPMRLTGYTLISLKVLLTLFSSLILNFG